MNENLLIPLPGFNLPTDFPWRVGFVAAVDEHLQRLRTAGHFLPSRFFGYYFRGTVPVAVNGSWTVTLDLEPPVAALPELVERVTGGKYDIESVSQNRLPEYILIHDTHDGTGWLWSFERGLRFVEATEPVFEVEAGGLGGARNPRRLGP